MVAADGKKVIKSVYPHGFGEPQQRPDDVAMELRKQLPAVTFAKQRDGVVLAFDIAGLVKLAEQHDCIIEMVPQVGDHIAAGDPLLRVFGGKTPIAENALSQVVAVGMERTLEQDPTFAFRIMVDIASKGLSPAINDPTTAVLALDQIHRLLRFVGTRDLETGLVHDANGRLRLIYRTPDWEDFICLSVTEIRQFGSESIQIARRLKAMLENLIQVLPESRRPLLQRELTILKRTADRFFSDPEDRALAEESDAQGVGGKSMPQ